MLFLFFLDLLIIPRISSVLYARLLIFENTNQSIDLLIILSMILESQVSESNHPSRIFPAIYDIFNVFIISV